MTNYAAPADVRLALSPDGDQTDVESAASLEDGDLNAAIQAAQDEVDGKIAARYQLPLVTVPDILMRITRDIAGWLATLTYRRGDPIDPHDPVQLRYNAAEALLTQIQLGTLALGTDVNDGPDLVPVFGDTSAGTVLFGVYDPPCGPEYPPITGRYPGFYPYPY